MITILDCEGPISKNDNAFEACANFIPQGSLLFQKLSRYDDYLSIIGRSGYKAGNTLKLVVPFLKAYGADNQLLKEFSTSTLILMPNIIDNIRKLQNIMATYIVSTSYSVYISALCDRLQFPIENTYSTYLDLDSYKLTDEEVDYIKELCEEIIKLPIVEFDEANGELYSNSIEAVRRLDTIFWAELPKKIIEVDRMFKEVEPVGGIEKANAVSEVAEKNKTKLQNVMYIGDSITDVEALQLIQKNGGLTVAFNANRYAIKNAEVCCIAPDTDIFYNLSAKFKEGGRELVIDYIRSAAKEKDLPKDAKLWLINEADIEELIAVSERYRREVRGEAIGALG